MRKLLAITALFLMIGCSGGLGPDYSGQIPRSLYPSQTLLIYGGADGDIFLGKLNARNYDSESIWNTYGKYGNKYNSESIWNSYGKFGGEYSGYSPFNPYASYPPVLVDSYGNFYGYFTCNQYSPRRARSDVADIICEHYKEIRKDISGWYKKIFE